MKITRKQFSSVLINTNTFQISDQISVGKYTATCQKVTDQGAIFFLDQSLNKSYQMNHIDTNKGGYDASDLRKNLISDFAVDKNFDSIREHLVPFDNGDIVRIPTIAELFGYDDRFICEQFLMDDSRQWVLTEPFDQDHLIDELFDNNPKDFILELAKIVSYRTLFYNYNEYKKIWLQNIVVESMTNFGILDDYGIPDQRPATNFLGVRPVFMLKIEEDK